MSRYQTCPICSRSVAIRLINQHLDEHLQETSMSRPKKRQKLQVGQPSIDGVNESDNLGGKTPAGRTPPFKFQLLTRPSQQSASLAFVQRAKGSKKEPISDGDLRSCTPCEVVRDVLPVALAERVLSVILEDAKVKCSDISVWPFSSSSLKS